MTAREQLREQVESMSEDQARDALVVLASRRLVAVHAGAPPDDEPDDDSPELAEAREQVRRGETVGMEQARRALLDL